MAARIGGVARQALVDTGCAQSMVSERIAGKVRGDHVVATVDNRLLVGIGKKRMDVAVADKVISSASNGFEVILGMEINHLGGVGSIMRVQP